MTATIIANSPQHPFGQMTNQTVGRLVSLNVAILRLQEAVATAASAWGGIPGTEYEIGNGLNSAPPNNFGVQADPTTPGAKGSDFAYAVDSLANAWRTAWPTLLPFIEQLDNGAAAF